MTDYTHDEENMSRDEIALRLTIETALKKCYESECTTLEKELENTKASFETLLKGANANASALSLENEKLKKQIAELCSKGKEIDSLERENMKLKAKYGELLTCHNDLKHELDICTKEIKHLREITTDDHISNLATKLNYECATKENEKLRKKVANQKTQLVDIQQALLNRNMTIAELKNENDRLKKEVKETRVVFEPSSYLKDIWTKNEEIRTLRKKNLDLKNENEGLKLKYDHLADVRDARIRELKAMTNDYYGILNAYTDLKNENDRLKKEVKETRVVFEPSSYLKDIWTKNEEIRTLRKKNLDLKNENEGLKLKYDHLNADLAKKVHDNIELNEQIEKDIQDYNKLFHEKEKLEKDLEDANKLASPTQPLYEGLHQGF